MFYPLHHFERTYLINLKNLHLVNKSVDTYLLSSYFTQPCNPCMSQKYQVIFDL